MSSGPETLAVSSVEISLCAAVDVKRVDGAGSDG